MPGKPVSTQEQLLAENEELQARLDEAIEILRAIRSSEVDALIVPGVGGEQVYTLKGADRPYRVLIEAMSEGALTLAMDGVILYANQSLADMLKMPLEKVIGSSIQAWITPDSQPILKSLLGKNIHNNRREQLDFTASDGSQVPVSLSASNLFENEIPVSFCLVATDLTEHKHNQEIIAEEKLAKELLAAANQSRRALLSVIEDQKRATESLVKSEKELIEAQALGKFGNWNYDLESQIITWSDQVYQLFERDPKLGPPTPEDNLAYYSPDQAKILNENTERAIEEEKNIEFDQEVDLPTGKHRHFSTKIKPVKNAQGQVVSLVGTIQDVSDRIQKEEEIVSRNQELSALYTLSRLLADAIDLENVIELVVRHAAESIHITFACIALLENGFIVRRRIYPVRPLDHEIVKEDSQPLQVLPAIQDILNKTEAVILQADNPEISSIERTTILLDHAQSICVVPLRVGVAMQGSNLALGLLILGEARMQSRDPFTHEKIHLARSIGDQAASAIRRMLVSEQARHRLERIASLREIDSAISKSFDLRLSLDVILKHVCEQLNVDAADVLVANTTLQTIEFKAGRGIRTRANEHTNLRFGESLAGQAVLERRMIQIPDMAASGTVFARPEFLKDDQIAAYFGVPLIIKGKVNGVLEVFQRSPLEPDEEWFDFLNTLAGQTAIAIDNDQMFYGLQRSNLELSLAYDATIEGWSHALDLRDKETEGHTLRVTEMTVKLARSFNITNDALKQIRWGALLHDIGKMGVPDGILHKPGPLTDEEWLVMKKHPIFAYEMISPILYLKNALDIPYCHHEKWDGSGYPRSLKGEQIPLAARIFAVVDVYDALTSDRPYRKAWTKEKTLEYIRSESGTHFDPQVVKLFLQEQR